MVTPSMLFGGPQFILNIKLLRWANFYNKKIRQNRNKHDKKLVKIMLYFIFFCVKIKNIKRKTRKKHIGGEMV